MPKPFSRDKSWSIPSLRAVSVAILLGIFIGLGLATLGRGARFQLLGRSLPAQTTLSGETVWLNETAQDVQQNTLSSEELELKYLNDMISKTNGFYAREYSLSLGWNNMRYIIETALLHGRLLNRTTIIPSFVYARACEFDLAACAAYAKMVNRGDAVHLNDWRELPIEQQMAWRIPITLMFNITHLRQSHPVITTADYLRLHNISTEFETTDGRWNTDTYHVLEMGSAMPTLHVIENEWYDPDSIVRVDRVPDDMRLRGGWSWEGGDPTHDQPGSWTNTSTDSDIYRALIEALPEGRPIIGWDSVRRIVEDEERIALGSSVEQIGDVLRENGFEVLYTYDGAGGMDFVKDVILPAYEAVPRHRIRGLCEDFHNISARVLLLRGEVHLGRKPGSLYFTTPAGQMRFSQTVLHDIRLVDDVLSLAEQINDRMFALTGGRLWMAAHMRRGDFVRYGWVMEANITAHLARIKKHLSTGRDTLISIHGGTPTTYNVPNVEPDTAVVTLDPPNPGDRFYIATDERDPENLKYLREQGAILITDLLTQEDHRACGWPIMFTDVLALLEQSIMSRAAFFYAHVFSSMSGGVMNLRAGLGKDPRTAFMD